MTINPFDILKTHYPNNRRTYRLLVRHSENVAQKALTIAQKCTELKPDLEFIVQAAMLHDIGIGWTNTPALGCTGLHPYVCHGVLGRRVLEQHGLFRHALVCERHIGVGLYAEEIERLNFPMPIKEMLPLSIEEKIICYSDKFFSKKNNSTGKEKSIPEIINGLRCYGIDKVLRFYALHNDLNSIHP
jgi:uncharacterized protein